MRRAFDARLQFTQSMVESRNAENENKLSSLIAARQKSRNACVCRFVLISHHFHMAQDNRFVCTQNPNEIQPRNSRIGIVQEIA